MEVDLVIRPTAACDCETIASFNCHLAMESEGRLLDRNVVAGGVARALEHPAYCRYFVAEIQGQVIGQTMITFEWSDWENGLIWWIQSVYIHPDYRRQGYFRKIFEWVVEQVRQDPDAVGLRLYVDRHNQPALATYEKLGMSRMDYLIYELKYKQDGDS